MNLLQYSKTLSYKENKIFVGYCYKFHWLLDASQVTVIIGLDQETEYLIGQYKITAFQEENCWILLSSILHEYGHFLDEYYNPSLFFHTPHPEKSKKIYTKEEIDLELGSEERAWFYAEGAARMLQIPLQEWFYEDKTKSLKTYQSWAKRRMKRLLK